MTARAVIDRAALRHNVSRVRLFAPESQIMAVIKCDAYGHGAREIAHCLDSVDGFAVARVDEGCRLRAAGISGPIVVLEGVVAPSQWDECTAKGLEPVLHADWQIASLAQRSERPRRVWVKLDSGMHRLGFDAGRREELEAAIGALSDVEIAGWMTHLASADQRSSTQTSDQIAAFDAAITGVHAPVSIANSAGIIAFPNTHRDWVRPGIMLYGVSPMEKGVAADHGLRPVMTLASTLISTRVVTAGEPVGYGGTWVAKQSTRVGVVAAGYGDGYPRHAATGTPVIVNGVRASLVGRVSMDMITIDLSSVPDAEVGDSVTLWGDGLPVEEIAAQADTIGYELLCNVGSRVERIYR